MAKFSDAWKNNQQFYPEGERFTVQTPPDPGHGNRDELPNAIVMIDAPVLQSGGELYGDYQFENAMHLPPATEIDKTPVEGHGTAQDRGHGYGGIFALLSVALNYGRGYLGAVRGRDLGAPAKATHEYGRPYKFASDYFFGFLLHGFDAPPITEGPGDKVLRRGLNAYPENDGDGGRTRAIGSGSWRVNSPSWREGWYLGSNVNRDFSPPNRTHDKARMVRPNIVTIVTSAPPPTVSDKYASPFFSLAKFRPKVRKPRGLRRVPGPWDEQVVADSTPSYEIAPADGMVVR